MSVTACPRNPGFAEGVTIVIVATAQHRLGDRSRRRSREATAAADTTALIVVLPSASEFVVKTADPFVRGTVPSVVEPLMKVTVPAGVPVPEAGATVAVKLTG